MGEIHIDGQPWTTSLPATACTADVYAELLPQIHEQGRMVVEVLLDGSEIHWQDGSSGWQQPFAAGRTLEIHTDTPQSLVQSVFTGMHDVLSSMAEAHRLAAGMLRRGEKETGIAITLETIGYWPEITKGLEGVCQLVGVQLSDATLQPSGSAVLHALAQLEKQMTDFREAADLSDFVLLADLLDYELAPLAETLDPLCQQLAERFKQQLSMQGGAS